MVRTGGGPGARPAGGREPGRYRRYDWVRGRFEGWVEVPVAPVLLLEGVSTARRTAPVAFAVWVEAPRELRLARVLSRDGASLAPQWKDWMRAEDEWFTADGTRAHADLLLDGAAVPGEFVRIQ
ncbi:uridine kinase [Streptosporangium lutulentum]